MNFFIKYLKIKLSIMNQVIAILLYFLAIVVSITAVCCIHNYIQKEIEKSAERSTNSRHIVV